MGHQATFKVIAERVLTCPTEPLKEVTVKVGMPEPSQEAQDFKCHYQITGPNLNILRYAVGLDSVQAIQLAFRSISAHLSRIEQEWGAPLRWSDSDSAFPTG